MSTPLHIKIWQSAFAEYRAGASKKKARININKMIGRRSISKQMIKYYYEEFLLNENCFFNGNWIIPVIQTLSNGKEVRANLIRFLQTRLFLNSLRSFRPFKSQRSIETFLLERHC